MSISLSFSSLITTLTSIIFAIFVYRLGKLLMKEKMSKKNIKDKFFLENSLVGYFFGTFAILDFSMISFAAGLLFLSYDQYLLGASKIFGDIFLYLSFAYGINIPLFLKYPKINRHRVVLALSFISSILIVSQLFNPPKPELIDSIIRWNLNPIIGWIIYGAALVMWVPTGLIFLQEGIRLKENFLKYLFLSLSFIILSAGGCMMLVATSRILLIISHISLVLGSGFMLLGMFYKSALNR